LPVSASLLHFFHGTQLHSTRGAILLSIELATFLEEEEEEEVLDLTD